MKDRDGRTRDYLVYRVGLLKPWQNATDRSFNEKLREEDLNLHWFRNRVDARGGIEQRWRHYNEVRPHSSFGYLTPLEFKARSSTGGGDG